MGKKKGGGGGGNSAAITGGDQSEGAKVVIVGVEEIEEKIESKEEKVKVKEDGGSMSVVLKVCMHCEGCIREVKKSVKGLEGTEKVTVDVENNKLTVVGTKLDPIRIRDRIRAKTHKLVELISPLPKKSSDPSKKDSKPKEPQAATVVLKIRLHCEGCIERIRKTIMRIKGVASVSMEPQKDQVTVRGTMDPRSLPEILTEKLKRTVEVVPPKKDKDPQKDGGAGCGGGGGGGDKKKKEEEMVAAQVEAIRMQYAYYVHNLHAPQLFSDENPNACSIL